MQHKIREQVLDLTINSQLDAFRVQHLAGPFYYRMLVPALEKIFDELSNEDEIVSIDKLEVDLGIILMQDLENTLPNNAWEKTLREHIKTAMQEQRMPANMQRTSISNNSARQWLFYMERGYIEWNNGGFDEKKIQSVLEVLATDYILVEQLRKLISKNNDVLYRIVRGHEENILISLVEILTASSHQNLAAGIKELVALLQLLRQKTANINFSPKQLQQEIWTRIFSSAAPSANNANTEKLVKAILNAEKQIIPIGESELSTSLKIISPQWKEALKGKKEELISTKPIEQEITRTNTTLQELDEDGVYVTNAGVVLLHPFLSTFFKRLNLVDNGKFIDTEKAIHLLHFLATGKTNPEEHDLVIPKLLCEIPLQQALKEIIDLTEEEKQEANDLLSVTIEKWEKLGSISIEALRENFLKRAGKLYKKNDQLFLQLENNALDILLDYLPWTLSIIKLPWMKQLLRIEWR